MSFLVGLATTLIYYFILIFSNLGLGWMASRLLHIKFSQAEKLFSLVWLGWAATLLILQLINLFAPISIIWSALLFLSGLASVYFFIKTDIEYIRTIHISKLWLGFVGLAAILIAIVSMQVPKAYDSGLYHFNSIRWLNEYPIVLGLGNLHGRLAFNQSFFAFVAYLNLYPLFKYGYYIANGFLLFLLLIEELFQLSKRRTNLDETVNFSATKILIIFVVPVTIYLALHTNLSAPAPDTASDILQILIFIYFIRALDSNIANTNNDAQILFIFIMSATAITVKISNLVYVLTICAILLIAKLRYWQLPPQQTVARILKMLPAPIFITAIWMLRGILLSGCPVYPSTFGCIHTSWSVPIEAVQSQADWIYAWARVPRETPDKILSSWGWLKPWFNSVIWANKLLIVYPLTIACVALTALIIIFIRKSSSKTLNKDLLWAPFPILTALIFWFFSAPDVRFVQVLILLFPIAVAAILISIFGTTGKLRDGIIIVMFLIVNTNIAWIIFGNTRTVIEFPVHGFAPIRTVRLIKSTTISGLDVFSPKKDDQCWDSELPCTPEFNDELEFNNRIFFPEFRLISGIK
ncbi:MAG: hypothetical protein ABI986_03225 [Chloroflexota bacterium]